MRIVIDDVEISNLDLALAAVRRYFTEPRLFDEDLVHIDQFDIALETISGPAGVIVDGVRVRRLHQPLAVTSYVPCPRRGEHTKLTECWMCWSDVMSGAALEYDALTPWAWFGDAELD